MRPFNSSEMVDDFNDGVGRIGNQRDAKDPDGLEKTVGAQGIGVLQNWWCRQSGHG